MERQAEVLERRGVYVGRVVDLGVERVRLPNGKTTELEIIRHPGAAAIVPVDSDGNVYLVHQYRHAVGQWILEVPAGKLDAGEEPEACARREVEEEIGLTARRLIPLGPMWTTPGFTDEMIWLFAAIGLEAGRQALEDDEALVVRRMPFVAAIEGIDRGEIRDGKSIVALLRTARLPEGLVPTGS